MVHFVYILGTASRWRDNELRYSLRSLQNFKGDEFDVWIVGHKPTWTKNVTHIACADVGSNPIVNVSRKLLFALDNLPESFVLMNDDFFIMRPIDAISVMHGGPMSDRIREIRGRKGVYVNAYRATYSVLQSLHIANPLRYDRHTPFPMTVSGLKELTIAWPSGEYLLKTVYGNLMYAPWTREGTADVKLKLPSRGPFWSSESVLSQGARQVLEKRFPRRSPYE